MKNLKYIALIVAATSFTACKKQLEEKPYGFLSTANFYKTEADANSALIYAYSILPDLDYYARNFITLTEAPTEDIEIAAGKSADNVLLDKLSVSPVNASLRPGFQLPYVGINRANLVITYVPAIATMSETSRNEVVGEAYALRALHYFNLVRLFGAVPMHLEPVDDPSKTNLPKSSMKVIYDQIIDDLTKATAKTDQVRRLGRVNQVGAWGLLSKVYLTLASGKSSNAPGYDFVANADEMYAKAKEYSSMVINKQSAYGLDPDLVSIYDVNKKAGPEHLWDASTDRTGTNEGLYSKLPKMFMPNLNFRLPNNVFVPGGFNEFLTEAALYNSFDANDNRKNLLIISTIKDVNGGNSGTGPTQNLSITDAYTRPFSNKFNDSGWQAGDQTSCNTPILRYSDVLLVYAEASGPTAEGYAAVKAIRTRAGLGDLPPGLSVQQFRDAVLQERSWELCFEGQRLFDLRRTNSMEKILVQKYGKTITGDGYFFPIPQSEVDRNPNLNN
ncbi:MULTISPECIES: RagB/SusD family nutrient uptake outer membrane protein [unclassified Mucilaginibacter]|uniref:RagB/SusD family nutrient uptake outer membrane protein n=1 Tax=unclassified Mucilaginibacter TaxID=2617802 RepID=UPI002AC8CCA9|nr:MULTISPECIES: RagB/SusD family nutrient uptake outer membrane protein [unclassified Mucilaginibacter]MEB0260087.1 RagB/SusD family nutrient uptake outer membrane protein [Mucilaginibacter sp. 10I4]MEB0279191.1 RagB/SusD family nutrient uptake outer membrane protein [Mucilaginibacter sp. 10B2]MEB0301975.1 RagB/SusD family nutrient uptake outer membrane protein [Mucilaginibacter sp. 5C4]WPX22370.1 RagB/SusD family nutrient uptake outer membrane protein [Mucilaginibacter sp. 5C4]